MSAVIVHLSEYRQTHIASLPGNCLHFSHIPVDTTFTVVEEEAQGRSPYLKIGTSTAWEYKGDFYGVDAWYSDVTIHIKPRVLVRIVALPKKTSGP
jgi:hypothetical protein